jgi:hypothetical protein
MLGKFFVEDVHESNLSQKKVDRIIDSFHVVEDPLLSIRIG